MEANPTPANHVRQIAPRCVSRQLPKWYRTACVASFCAGLVCLTSCGRVPETNTETPRSRVVERASLGDVADAEQTRESEPYSESTVATTHGSEPSPLHGMSPRHGTSPGGTEDKAEKRGVDPGVSSSAVKIPGGGWRIRLGSERHHRAIVRRFSEGHLSTECSTTAGRSDAEVMGGIQ